MAKEENTYDHELDIGLYEYAASSCGACHPGGGSMEYDRNGNRYDTFLASGGGPVLKNGDYYYFNTSSGITEMAPWDTAGVLEIDCLICHMPGYSTNARATQILSKNLYAAASAGAAFGTIVDNETVNYDPDLPVNGIDLNTTGDYHQNCNQCHGMDQNGIFTASTSAKITKSDIRKRGMVWGAGGALAAAPAGFRDVHDSEGLSCLDCHTADLDHNITKGNARTSTVRNDLNFTMTSCKECHVDATDDLDKEGIDPTSAHSLAGFGGLYSFHMASLSCETCHIPYKSTIAHRLVDLSSGQLYNEAGTKKIKGKYGLYMGGSTDPSTWTTDGLKLTYQWWSAEDGSYQLKPMNIMSCIFWNEGEDISHPYFLRNVLSAGDALLAAGNITNDVANSFYEIDKAQEIADMRQELINVGLNVGDPKMTNPYFTVSAHYFSVSHNVRESGDALGASGCTDCHDSAANGGQDRWFFDGDYTVWNYPIEDSPYLADHLTYIKRDGSTGHIDIDFSQIDHNKVKNWKLMGYTQAEHDQLVIPRTP